MQRRFADSGFWKGNTSGGRKFTVIVVLALLGVAALACSLPFSLVPTVPAIPSLEVIGSLPAIGTMLPMGTLPAMGTMPNLATVMPGLPSLPALGTIPSLGTLPALPGLGTLMPQKTKPVRPAGSAALELSGSVTLQFTSSDPKNPSYARVHLFSFSDFVIESQTGRYTHAPSPGETSGPNEMVIQIDFQKPDANTLTVQKLSLRQTLVMDEALGKTTMVDSIEMANFSMKKSDSGYTFSARRGNVCSTVTRYEYSYVRTGNDPLKVTGTNPNCNQQLDYELNLTLQP